MTFIALGPPNIHTIPLKGRVSLSSGRSSIAARPSKLFCHVIPRYITHFSASATMLSMPCVVTANRNAAAWYFRVGRCTEATSAPIARCEPNITRLQHQQVADWTPLGPKVPVLMPDNCIIDCFTVIIDNTQSLLDHPSFSPNLVRVLSTGP